MKKKKEEEEEKLSFRSKIADQGFTSLNTQNSTQKRVCLFKGI
jgi:hypothetical protein